MNFTVTRPNGFDLFCRTALSVLALIAVFLVFSPVGQARTLSNNLIRLHVLANSDSASDQELKLKVRDGVLSVCGELFSDCGSVEEAVSEYYRSRGIIESSVRSTLISEGCPDLDFDITLSREHYDTREYDGFALPCGDYLSLRILLGKAEGRNWWCVLFPPLCTESSLSVADRLSDAGVDDGASELATGGRYRVRFRIAEFFGSLCDFFSDRG